MAWRTSGTSNEELVDGMNTLGLVPSALIRTALLTVDRGDFVPAHMRGQVYQDCPVKDGNFHMSAPHIYTSVLHALEISEGISFLNVGSGTGYLSTMVAWMSGSEGINHGIEVHRNVIEHARHVVQLFIDKLVAEELEEHECRTRLESVSSASSVACDDGRVLPTTRVRSIEFCHGNIFDVDPDQCIRYDRIYIGGGAPGTIKDKLIDLLAPGGILVGPIDGQLLKIRRIGEGSELEETSLADVCFAPLVPSAGATLIPLPQLVWAPVMHSRFPDDYKDAVVQMLLIASRTKIPRSTWFEILSFTNREWFTSKTTVICRLRSRLKREVQARVAAERYAHDCKRAKLMIERERDMYRHLFQSLTAQLQARSNQGEENLPHATDFLPAPTIGSSEPSDEEQDPSEEGEGRSFEENSSENEAGHEPAELE